MTFAEDTNGQGTIWDLPEQARREAIREREATGLLALVSGALAPMPDLQATQRQSPVVVESLRQLHRDLAEAGHEEFAKRVQSIIFLATCNKGMRLLHEVASKHGVSARDIRSENRAKNVTKARQEVCFRLVKELEWSTIRTGEFIGRDHTTVLYAIEKFEARQNFGEEFAD